MRTGKELSSLNEPPPTWLFFVRVFTFSISPAAFAPSTPKNLPAWFTSQTLESDPLQEERASIVAALEHRRWNKSKAAADLRWSRMTLYRKLARHRIQETRAAAAAG